MIQGEAGVYEVEPGACIFEVNTPSWDDFVPGPLNDVQFGVPQGILVALMKVNDAGAPQWSTPAGAGCLKLDANHVVIAIPDTPGIKYKIRLVNMRTYYWGSPGGILKVAEPPPPAP
jgi:hypothetical protein